MIAVRDMEPHGLVGVRIEVHEAGWLRFGHLGVDELSVHPEAEFDGLGFFVALAGKSDAHNVFAVKGDLGGALDQAGGDPADPLVLVVKLDFERLLGQRIGPDGSPGDAAGGR